MIDINSLTLEEGEFFEDVTGMPMTSLADTDKPKMRALATLFYIFKKRENENFTLEEAKKYSLVEVNAYLGMDGAEPTEAEGKGKPSRK